jgi:hypothetical protein
MEAKGMTLSEQLQGAISESGLSLYAVSQGAGIDYASLHHFVTEDTDIRISTASALAEFFQMHLTKPKKIKAPPDGRRRQMKGG